MQEHSYSPLNRLVLFIACLAVAGVILAGILYVAGGLPQQTSGLFPENSNCLADCKDACKTAEENCKMSGNPGCIDAANQCTNTCSTTCACSDCQDACKSDYDSCTGKMTTCMNTFDRCTDKCPC